MDKFIHRLNIERYQRLLENVTDGDQRERIEKLLAEEMRKQPDDEQELPPRQAR